MLIARWVLGNHADCRLTDYFLTDYFRQIRNSHFRTRIALRIRLRNFYWVAPTGRPLARAGSPGVLFQRVLEILGFGAHVGL
jgi:hypothetical protein